MNTANIRIVTIFSDRGDLYKNLNHEHIRGGWIDSWRIVLLAREVLDDAGA